MRRGSAAPSVSCREVDCEFAGPHGEARTLLTEVWQVLIVGTHFGSNELRAAGLYVSRNHLHQVADGRQWASLGADD